MSFLKTEKTQVKQHLLGFDAIKCNFNLLETFSLASLEIAHMCQLSIFLTSILHMKSIFTEKKESLCLCLQACSFQAYSGRGFDCRGTGGGAWQSSVRSLASVISGHSAVLEGLRMGTGGWGNELVIDGSQAQSPILIIKKEKGESEKLLLCFNENDFLEMAN